MHTWTVTDGPDKRDALGETGTHTVNDVVERRDDPFQVSLILPAWNEEATIEQAVQEARAALAPLTLDFEIIVVDDGSADRTAEIVKCLADRDGRVRLVQHSVNRGYGAALRTGFEAARFGLVAFTDADCQFDLTEFEYVLPLTRRYDIACGCRIDRQDPGRRLFFSWGYNTLVRLLLGSAVHDIDCAFKVFHRQPLLQILPECDNFFVNTEMLARASQQKLSVVEVGVRHRARAGGQSKVSLREIPRTLASLLPFWWSQTLFRAPNPEPPKLGRDFWAGFIVVACLAAALLFPKLSYALVEPDEGRYAEIGREMLRAGDWVVPTLNHEPYPDKPPLLYWLLAFSLHLFGTSTWAARLVPATAAFLTVLATFCFACRVLGTRVGFLAGLALAVMAGFIQCGRFLVTDGLLAFFEAVALFAAYEAIRAERLRWSWWLIAAVFCALGFLTKGPIALLCFAVPVSAHVWLTRGSLRIGRMGWAVFVTVALLLAAPWFVLMMAREPDFSWQFILEHHLMRFLSSEYHEEPFWYYVPVLLVGCLPWSLFLFPMAKFLFSRGPAHASLRPQVLGFFVVWIGWFLGFFSASRGKLPTYVLPVAPAIAILLGWYFDLLLFNAASQRSLRRASANVPWLTVVVLSVIWLGGSVGTWWMGLIHSAAHRWFSLIAAGVAGILLVAAATRRMPPRSAWGACAAMGMLILIALSQNIVPAWSARRSPLSQVRGLLQDKQVGVLCLGEEWGSVPFRLDDDQVFLHGKKRSPRELESFLTSHERTLLFTKDYLVRETVRTAVPAGHHVAAVIRSGQASVLLVETGERERGPGGTQ